jgi:hypothetical protein
MIIGVWTIRPGDSVTIVDRFGQRRTGRASPLLLFPTHAVLNMGGPYGTPAVATPDNIVAVRQSTHNRTGA